MQRRMPISRVRSITLIVIAFASPTMLIATIRKPSTAIDVVIVLVGATSSRLADVLDLGADRRSRRGERVLEPRGRAVDERVVVRGRS